MKGVDYGYGKPNAAKIKALGFEFVCRYLSHSPGKNLNAAELQDLRANGLQIVLVWESTADRVLGGFDAGQQDAGDALQQVNQLGLSGNGRHYPVLYFACDDDFNDSQQEQINSYFQGVASRMDLAYIGVYGSYDVVRRTLDKGLATFAWQTYAWSHHQWDPRAQLRQIQNGLPIINGVECDIDQAMQDNFGQFE